VSILDNTAQKCKWNDTADECVYLDPVMTVEVSESISLSLSLWLFNSYIETCMHDSVSSYFFFC
jgi:hypothetical protein